MYMGEFLKPSSKLTPCPEVSSMGSNAYILQYFPLAVSYFILYPRRCLQFSLVTSGTIWPLDPAILIHIHLLTNV